MTTGAAPASLPERRANMLPMASTRTSRPASRHHSAKRSRPSRSAGGSGTPRTPPPRGAAPPAPQRKAPAPLAMGGSERSAAPPAFGRGAVFRQLREGGPEPLGVDRRRGHPSIQEPPLEQRADTRVRARVGEAEH